MHFVQIANLAVAGKKRDLFAVIYDDLLRLVFQLRLFFCPQAYIRRHIEDMSCKLGSSFKLAPYVKDVQNDIHRRATTVYEQIFAAKDKA